MEKYGDCMYLILNKREIMFIPNPGGAKKSMARI